jgi:AcrR family transcriptional regulator
MAGTARKPRRSQEERSAGTQLRIMDATLECLIEYGYAGTTVARVAERAGVSRGAQLHHYPSKATLVAKAIEHLAARRAEEFAAKAGKVSSARERVGAALDVWFDDFDSPLFEATLELFVAARTDPEVRDHLRRLERNVSRSVRAAAPSALGPEVAASPDFERKVDMALATIRGLAVLRLIEPDRNLKRSWQYAREQLIRLLEDG